MSRTFRQRTPLIYADEIRDYHGHGIGDLPNNVSYDEVNDIYWLESSADGWMVVEVGGFVARSEGELDIWYIDAEEMQEYEEL